MFQALRMKSLFCVCLTLVSSFCSAAVLPNLIDRVRETVNYNASLNQQEEISEMLERLEESGTYLEQGGDGLRTKFVTLQGAIEQVLALAQGEKIISNLVGVIHTPSPTTPLCTPIGQLDLSLLDSSIQEDSDKVQTVASRSVILRKYLEQGAQLYVAYPKSGLKKRSKEQLKTYFQEVNDHPKSLKDVPLKIAKMDEDMIGATYFFIDETGKHYAFSIKGKQANDPSQFSEWGIWFGPLQVPAIEQRIAAVQNYLRKVSGAQIVKRCPRCSSN